MSIDLVPGKIHSGYKNYHSLYTSKNKSWLQTNIDIHIDKVIKSERQNEIILSKIWKQNHNLSFPSIYLELIVIEALKYKLKNQLHKNFMSVLEYLKSDFVDKKIEDPSNSNNVISDLLFKYEKEEIKKTAKNCLEKKYINDIVW